MPCRDHAAQLRRSAREFERRGVGIAFVTFAGAERARSWKKETEMPFPVLLDPDRAGYRAFGLERSRLRVWHPRVLLRYARHILSGKRLPKMGGDPFQLGGDFVVDERLRVTYAHPSRDPSDRPKVREILAALDARAGTT